jgi:hypothetical protein
MNEEGFVSLIEPIPTPAQTVKSICIGLLPYEGDFYDLSDGLDHLIGAARCLGHLAVRLLMMGAFPVTVILLYPLVRASQRDHRRKQEATEARRKAMIAELTKLTQKA